MKLLNILIYKIEHNEKPINYVIKNNGGQKIYYSKEHYSVECESKSLFNVDFS